jgi:hypothetical protein
LQKNKETRRQGDKKTGRYSKSRTPRAELPQNKCLELLELHELLVYIKRK